MSIGLAVGKLPSSATVPVMEPVVLESTSAGAASDWVVCRLPQPAKGRRMTAVAKNPLIDERDIRTSELQNWGWKQLR